MECNNGLGTGSVTDNCRRDAGAPPFYAISRREPAEKPAIHAQYGDVFCPMASAKPAAIRNAITRAIAAKMKSPIDSTAVSVSP